MDRTVSFNELIYKDECSANPDRPVREWLDEAGIILGVDEATGRESVFWNFNLWQMVRNNAVQPRVEVNILRVKLNENDAGELMTLASFVREVKGPGPHSRAPITRDEQRERLRGLLGKGHPDSSIATTIGVSAEEFAELKAEIENDGAR